MGTVEYRFVNDAGESRTVTYSEDTEVPVGMTLEDDNVLWTCTGREKDPVTQEKG